MKRFGRLYADTCPQRAKSTNDTGLNNAFEEIKSNPDPIEYDIIKCKSYQRNQWRSTDRTKIFGFNQTVSEVKEAVKKQISGSSNVRINAIPFPVKNMQNKERLSFKKRLNEVLTNIKRVFAIPKNMPPSRWFNSILESSNWKPLQICPWK